MNLNWEYKNEVPAVLFDGTVAFIFYLDGFVKEINGLEVLTAEITKFLELKNTENFRGEPEILKRFRKLQAVF